MQMAGLDLVEVIIFGGGRGKLKWAMTFAGTWCRAPQHPKSRDYHPDHATVKRLSPESQCRRIIAQISFTFLAYALTSIHCTLGTSYVELLTDTLLSSQTCW